MQRSSKSALMTAVVAAWLLTGSVAGLAAGWQGESFLPLALSSILASPSAAGVTTPSLLTAATLEFDDLKRVCPVTSWSEPSASFPVTTMRCDAHLPANTKSPGAA